MSHFIVFMYVSMKEKGYLSHLLATNKGSYCQCHLEVSLTQSNRSSRDHKYSTFDIISLLIYIDTFIHYLLHILYNKIILFVLLYYIRLKTIFK